MDNRQYREVLIRGIVENYRELKRIDKVLSQSKFQKVYKDPTCKSAGRLALVKKRLLEMREEASVNLHTLWRSLPEIRSLTEETEIGMGPLEFAAQCAKRPRRRKFLKNQLVLTP